MFYNIYLFTTFVHEARDAISEATSDNAPILPF